MTTMYETSAAQQARRLRVFVTGATGVVGRRAVPLLVAAGHEVTALGRTPEKRRALEQAGALTVGVSLFDREGLLDALAGHDAVVNLATHVPRSSGRMLLPWAWRENDCVRRDGSARLADAALATGVRRFVQESFAPIYAGGADRWLDEAAPVQPPPHARTVLDAERSAARFAAAGGGVGVVLRFGGFYGPDAFHLRDMVRSTRAGWAPLPGAADAYWSSLSHDDAATAVVAALAAPTGVYNVTDDEPLTRRALADALAAAFGLRPPRLLPPWAPRVLGPVGELLSRSQRIANRAFRSATHWAPRFPSARKGFRALGDAPAPAREGGVLAAG